MIRVKNRTIYPVALPAPYKGTLGPLQSEVIDTTPGNFNDLVGGDKGNIYDIVGIPNASATPTVTENTNLGGSSDTGEVVEAATTSGSKHSVTKTKTISRPTVDAAAFFELPTAAAATAYADYVVKDGKGIAGANTITVTVSGGGNIDGAASATITGNYGALVFVSDGTNWNIL